MPKRIQRRRAKGWRMPENAVYVGRSSKWGNPYAVTHCDAPHVPDRHWHVVYDDGAIPRIWKATEISKAAAVEHAIWGFRDWLAFHPHLTEAARHELAGRDLVCWCPLDQPCHADVLLGMANHAQTRREELSCR